jgi:hypothetical protein
MKYLLALVVVVAAIRVAATHRVFSPVYDELLHLAAGHEYLTQHRYSVDLEHPPLARAVEALPFVRVPPPSGNWVEQGNGLLASGGDYVGGIAKGRRGNLLFLVIGIVAVFEWARERFDMTTGVLAAALFSLLPPVLAHAGLATTDMAGAAALPLALWALDRRSTLLLGAAIAFGLLTKFSFVPFFGASALVVYVLGSGRLVRSGRATARLTPRMSGRDVRSPLLIAIVAVWLAYFGSFGTMTAANPALRDDAKLAFGTPWIADHVVMPAPLFAGGLLKLKLDDQVGRDAFLLGRYSHTGWWYYFPIVLGVKTPLPFLFLVVLGAIVSKRTWPILAVAAVILAIAMTTHINVGVRHILPIYGPLSIVAAQGLQKFKWIGAILALWLVTDSALAHPDYLSWMNAAAGRHPERVLSDSNLDWGQDLIRLRHVARTNHIDDLGMLVFTRADLNALGFRNVHHIDPHNPSTGWFAVSETEIAIWNGWDPTAFRWLLDRPDFTRVGTSIRLYRVTR